MCSYGAVVWFWCVAVVQARTRPLVPILQRTACTPLNTRHMRPTRPTAPRQVPTQVTHPIRRQVPTLPEPLARIRRRTRRRLVTRGPSKTHTIRHADTWWAVANVAGRCQRGGPLTRSGLRRRRRVHIFHC